MLGTLNALLTEHCSDVFIFKTLSFCFGERVLSEVYFNHAFSDVSSTNLPCDTSLTARPSSTLIYPLSFSPAWLDYVVLPFLNII